MARAVFPRMREQGGGRIVNVVGMAARNPAATYMTGGAANAALINFTKALADLGAPSNILVTAVSPGPVKTERWDNLLRQQAEAAGQDLQAYIKDQNRTFPRGRIALGGEVGDLVCFVASRGASFLRGIAIPLEGGISRGVSLWARGPRLCAPGGPLAPREIKNAACSPMRTCPLTLDWRISMVRARKPGLLLWTRRADALLRAGVPPCAAGERGEVDASVLMAAGG